MPQTTKLIGLGLHLIIIKSMRAPKDAYILYSPLKGSNIGLFINHRHVQEYMITQKHNLQKHQHIHTTRKGETYGPSLNGTSLKYSARIHIQIMYNKKFMSHSFIVLFISILYRIVNAQTKCV